MEDECHINRTIIWDHWSASRELHWPFFFLLLLFCYLNNWKYVVNCRRVVFIPLYLSVSLLSTLELFEPEVLLFNESTKNQITNLVHSRCIVLFVSKSAFASLFPGIHFGQTKFTLKKKRRMWTTSPSTY